MTKLCTNSSFNIYDYTTSINNGKTSVYKFNDNNIFINYINYKITIPTITENSS